MIGLTRHMTDQLGQFGVTVNCIAPGVTSTEATWRQVPRPVKPMFAQTLSSRSNVQPAGMAVLATFFASDEASFVNGQTICVEGGKVMTV